MLASKSSECSLSQHVAELQKTRQRDEESGEKKRRIRAKKRRGDEMRATITDRYCLQNERSDEENGGT